MKITTQNLELLKTSPFKSNQDNLKLMDQLRTDVPEGLSKTT